MEILGGNRAYFRVRLTAPNFHYVSRSTFPHLQQFTLANTRCYKTWQFCQMPK